VGKGKLRKMKEKSPKKFKRVTDSRIEIPQNRKIRGMARNEPLTTLVLQDLELCQAYFSHREWPQSFGVWIFFLEALSSRKTPKKSNSGPTCVVLVCV